MRSTDDTRPDGGTATGFEWVDVNDEETGRRLPLRAVWVVLAMFLVGLLASTLLLTGGASANTTFTASDVSVTGNAGHVKSVTVGPNGSVTYTGLEQPDPDVRVTVYVRNASSGAAYTQVAQKTVTASGYSGTVAYDFADTDIVGATPNLDKKNFRAKDGQTRSVDVDVKVNATIVGGDPNGQDVAASPGQDTFTVTVTNVKASGGLGGTANTNGQAKSPA